MLGVITVVVQSFGSDVKEYVSGETVNRGQQEPAPHSFCPTLTANAHQHSFKSHLFPHVVLVSHDNGSMVRILLRWVVQEHLLLPLHLRVLQHQAVQLAVPATGTSRSGVGSR